MLLNSVLSCLFFFNDTATTTIYTLSLHDALPIFRMDRAGGDEMRHGLLGPAEVEELDRKSTRLNSSHSQISYAVFCLKKKKCASLCSNRKLYGPSLRCQCRRHQD